MRIIIYLFSITLLVSCNSNQLQKENEQLKKENENLRKQNQELKWLSIQNGSVHQNPYMFKVHETQNIFKKDSNVILHAGLVVNYSDKQQYMLQCNIVGDNWNTFGDTIYADTTSNIFSFPIRTDSVGINTISYLLHLDTYGIGEEYAFEMQYIVTDTLP